MRRKSAGGTQQQQQVVVEDGDNNNHNNNAKPAWKKLFKTKSSSSNKNHGAATATLDAKPLLNTTTNSSSSSSSDNNNNNNNNKKSGGGGGLVKQIKSKRAAEKGAASKDDDAEAAHEESEAVTSAISDLVPTATNSGGGASGATNTNTNTVSNNSKRKNDRLQKARAVLSRPFSRASLPPKKGRNWVVEVSPAEWDGDQSRWKYRILVQRRQIVKQGGGPSSAPSNKNVNPTSFTTAFTWRSLADFAWLEEALRAEYHGALLLPLLSIAIGTPDISTAQYEVDAMLLRDWFGDVLNGVRGQGEFVLEQQTQVVDLMASEALEAFLYRNTDPLPIMSAANHSRQLLESNTTSTLDLPWKDNSPEKETREASFVSSLWSKPYCTPFDGLCAAGVNIDGGDTTTTTSTANGVKIKRQQQKQKQSLIQQLPIDLMKANCSSRALEDTTSLQIQDSFVQYDPGEKATATRTHTAQLMEAERDLVECHRRSCLSAMERLRLLKEEESMVAGAWKRVAISLSNLYSYEKEVENSRVGGGGSSADNNKSLYPYRKLHKNTVDELLRVLARQKLERNTISLDVTDAMLRAHVGDLSAVAPSVKAYSDAASQLAQNNNNDAAGGVSSSSQHRHQQSGGEEESMSWQHTIKAMLNMVEIKKQATGHSVQTATTAGSNESEILTQKKAFEVRVLQNERLLRDCLTSLCRATPIRAARMAHHYFRSEATQATLLSSAAISLRTKVNLADRDVVLSKIRKRHEKECEADDAAEMELLEKLVNIGNCRKFEKKVILQEGSPQAEVISKDVAALRTKALELARDDRVGKWDSELALAIMEAVGIEDAEVQVEETTRDLRLVRRHAIGLRENLSRCVEALQILMSAILYGHFLDEQPDQQPQQQQQPPPNAQSICDGRRQFLEKCSLVFSGTMDTQQRTSASPSTSILKSAGIAMDDPYGWLTSPQKQHQTTTSLKPKAKCGAATLRYMDARDSDVEEFLRKMEGQMNDYKQRVESIESYVYMQCVGIQLEKHFSKKRADALTAFEKKTDIQTAINIAQRKRLPLLVQELNVKMEAVAAGITHTTVKESKEAHLLSKTLKGEIGDLALRRFQRTKESAMDNIVKLMSTWANYEEVATSKELKLLNKAVEEVEKSLRYMDLSCDGVSYMVEATKKRSSQEPLMEA